MFNKINSHNEWDKLKEVIIGTAQGTVATITWERKQKIDQKIIEKAQILAKESYPKTLLDEVEEDYQ